MRDAITSTDDNSNEFALVEDREFFAPTSTDWLDSLLGQYQQARQRIDQLAGLVAGDLGNVIHYFVEGNVESRGRGDVDVGRLFDSSGATKALDAAYWSKALAHTDVLDYMPQARRDAWRTQLTAWKEPRYKAGENPDRDLPEFSEDTVRPTISALLSMRAQFFGERVDGIFRALSHTHVTNCPEGFSKRMILSGVINEYGHTNSSQAGCINDLRCVIAKFMGRDEPKYYATDKVVTEARRRRGEWLTLDGGALRIRCYMVGTAHLEVHPDMAWRLNQVLAGMYPSAIPSEFRTKPKKRNKSFQMMGRPLPFAVVELLADMETAKEWYEHHFQKYARPIPRTRQFRYGSIATENKTAMAEAIRVIESIGGVKAGKHGTHFAFDYEPGDVIEEIVASGCVPDTRSHQFYPTPSTVAEAAIEMADIQPDDECLEPSAGQGGIACYMPKDRTTCVEISPLHCDILKAQGFTATCADFIEWADHAVKTGKRFDQIIMNPPYSEGRWQEHMEHAHSLLKAGGRLTIVLPASQRGKELLTDCNTEWSGVFENQFAGTGIAVAIMSVKRRA